MTVPPTSSIIHWTAENPWPFGVALIAVGLVAFSWALPRRSVVGKRAGFAAIAAAALLFALAAIIETGREAMIRRTTELIDHAIAGDAGAVDEILADSVVLTLGRDRLHLTKRDILARVGRLPDLVRRNNVWNLDAGVSGAGEGESVFGQTTATTVGQPLRNEWRVRWRRDESDGDEWRAVELIWERFNLNDVPSARMLP